MGEEDEVIPLLSAWGCKDAKVVEVGSGAVQWVRLKESEGCGGGPMVFGMRVGSQRDNGLTPGLRTQWQPKIISVFP